MSYFKKYKNGEGEIWEVIIIARSVLVLASRWRCGTAWVCINTCTCCEFLNLFLHPNKSKGNVCLGKINVLFDGTLKRTLQKWIKKQQKSRMKPKNIWTQNEQRLDGQREFGRQTQNLMSIGALGLV